MTVMQFAIIREADRIRCLPESKRGKGWFRIVAAAENIQRRLAVGETTRKTPIPKTSYEIAAETIETPRKTRPKPLDTLDIEAQE